MSSRNAHLGLHLTVLWPVVLGALGVLLYGAVYGGAMPSLAGEPMPRMSVEAWPAPAATAPDRPGKVQAIPSPVATDL